MKSFRISVAAAVAAVIAATAVGCNASGRDTFSLTVNGLPAEMNDRMVYLTDYDTAEKLDSVRVANSGAVFSGSVDAPALARLTVGDTRLGTFILEPGTITFDAKNSRAEGTPLNARLNAIGDSMQAIVVRFEKLPQDSTYPDRAAALEKEYTAVADRALTDNTDNEIGYYFFVSQAASMSLSELNEALEKYPQWEGKKRVSAIKDALKRKHETSPGHHYKDFTIPYDGREQKLSDYVKPGKLALVDFWASWCGPCIRETRVLKELYKKYSDKINFVGVAVWDEPDATLAAINRLQLPWPCIIDAGTIPTDLYGIQGIPCIILIGPDGTILSRDRQDAELVADVEKAVEEYAK